MLKKDNKEIVWCIPPDCVPFLAAATSWDRTYANIGNKFLSDTTDKILTQIRDLIDADEVDKWRMLVRGLVERTLAYTPSINQDLLIATVAEQIYFDHKSIIKEVDEDYEKSLADVFAQYKMVISARAASGDISEPCIEEIVCAIEQLRKRLLARAGKILRGDMITQIVKVVRDRLVEKKLDPREMDTVKDEFSRVMYDLMNKDEFKLMDPEKKAAFVQATFQNMILEKYNNDPNVQEVVSRARAVTLPIIRSHMGTLKLDRIMDVDTIRALDAAEHDKVHLIRNSSNNPIHQQREIASHQGRDSKSSHPRSNGDRKSVPVRQNQMREINRHLHGQERNPIRSRNQPPVTQRDKKSRANFPSDSIASKSSTNTICIDYNPYSKFEQFKRNS